MTQPFWIVLIFSIFGLSGVIPGASQGVHIVCTLVSVLALTVKKDLDNDEDM